MAADSSIDEAEGAPPVPIDERPSPLREAAGGRPRPPRPAKRPSGSLRIPLPSAVAAGSRLNGAARAGVLAAPAAPATPVPTSAPSSAPEQALSSPTVPTPVPTARASSTRPPAAVVTPEVPGDASANYEFQLTRRSSMAPPLSFDSAEVDPSDRAPGAPFTPWRNVPPLQEPSALESLPAAPAQPAPERDHEQTIVGEVSKGLLELSGEDEEENTRAYQAPAELIELARREREERRQAQAGSGGKRDAQAAFRASLPPMARLTREDDDQSDVHTATVPVVTVPAGDAAPPVELSRRARGSGAPGAGQRGRGAAPSLSELAREISERRIPGSLSPVGDVVRRGGASEPAAPSSMANFRSPWLTRGRIWALLVGLFIAVGYALARWRGLDLLR
ncbi:MAG: hypothetical protein ABI895_08875 [Deltaproteobacteria bacterium]